MITENYDAHISPRKISLAIQNLNYHYQNQPLFENFSHIFQGGQCHCIIGPSGVGKTTLLRIIAGLEQLETDSKRHPISLHPTLEISKNNANHLSNMMSWYSQQYELLPWLNIEQNVLLGYYLRGKPSQDIKEEAFNKLKLVGLEKWSKARPSALSGGMRQRVAFARTLLENKPIILMDEPFSSLDAIQRFEMQQLVSYLTSNQTVILVTHDPMEALRLGHQIHLLSGNPATIKQTWIPDGSPPRHLGDPEVLILYRQLIDALQKG